MANDAPKAQQPSREDIHRFLERWRNEPLHVHQLRDNVYWVGGAGGNSGIVIGDNGVIVIDAKVSAGAGKRLLDEVARLTPKPVTDVILTHGDGDHVMGLASFPAGLTIIAHENAQADMEAMNARGLMGTLPAAALPNHTFTTHQSAILQGIRFELFHFGPSHTTGDAVIHLPDQKVIFAGDILNWGGSPTPYVKDGSAAGWLSTVEEMLKLDVDTFVTGHGDPQTKADLAQKLVLFQQQYDIIKVMVAQGKSLQDVEEAMVVDAIAPQSQGLRMPSFATSAYTELTVK